MKIRKEEKLKFDSNATQIAVVSGTLRNKELSANIKKGFLDIVAGSDRSL